MVDDGSFAEFYSATYRGVVAQLFAYTGDLAEAQEATQEAFVRAWTRWHKIIEYDEPRAWVCRVAYRVAISRWRRARTAADIWRRQGAPPVQPPPDPATADLVAALRKLPEAQRRALVLHYLGGFSVAEIAALDGVASGTVKSRLSRGREALAGLLDGYGEPEDRLQAPAPDPPPATPPESTPAERAVPPATAPEPALTRQPADQPEEPAGGAVQRMGVAVNGLAALPAARSAGRRSTVDASLPMQVEVYRGA